MFYLTVPGSSFTCSSLVIHFSFTLAFPAQVEALLTLKEGFWPNGMNRPEDMGVELPR